MLKYTVRAAIVNDLLASVDAVFPCQENSSLALMFGSGALPHCQTSIFPEISTPILKRTLGEISLDAAERRFYNRFWSLYYNVR